MDSNIIPLLVIIAVLVVFLICWMVFAWYMYNCYSEAKARFEDHMRICPHIKPYTQYMNERVKEAKANGTYPYLYGHFLPGPGQEEEDDINPS